MGKVLTAFAGVSLLGAAVIMPFSSRPARAQSSTLPGGCSGSTPAYPMQGHYTGPWHSDGDYHFNAFGRDIDLRITIDGTIDATVTPDGRLSGTVQGKVDAPITHNGQRDVSSGYGTIGGSIQGVFSPGGGLVELPQPTILMHWGTFVGGGYTADRTITMPTYEFTVGSFNCVGSSGTISEQNFPVQNIVDDANGQLVQIPGVGSATGSWQLASDSTSTFSQLSLQVDAFIAQSNAVLNAPSGTLTPALIGQQIVQPLQRLETAIRSDPSVSRCLMDRLAAWEATAVPGLLQRALSNVPSDLVSLRQATDLLRSARLLNLDCAIADAPTASTLAASGGSMLDGSIARHDWSGAILLFRELVLLGGDAARTPLQQRMAQDLHAQVQRAAVGAGLLELARVSYVFGDDADATTAFQRLTAHAFVHVDVAKHRGKRHKKHGKNRKRRRHRSHHTPTATPTPKPKTLPDVLEDRIPTMRASVSADSATLTWQPVAGASRYLVTVADVGSYTLLWTWSGPATAATYGDTSLDGLSGTSGDIWPVSFGGGTHAWSILAFNPRGQIVGILPRATL